MTPAFTGGLGSLMPAASGGASMFAPALGMAPEAAAMALPTASPGLLSGLNWNKGMKGFQMAGDMMQKGQKEEQAPPPMPRPQVQLSDLSNDELRKRLMDIYNGSMA
jgi:hypothetical protein